MRVCIMTTAFPRWEGDSRAPFIFQAARALKNAGLEVTVVAMHNPGSKSREALGSIEVYRPQYLPERYETLQADPVGIPGAWRKNPLKGFAKLLPFLFVHSVACAREGRRASIIHANWTLSALAAALSSWWHKKPFVVTVQGSDIFQAAKVPAFRLVTRLVLKRARKVIALSHSLAEATHALGIPRERITVIPNGVDIEQFQPGPLEREPIILYVGSLIERKGPRYLVQALAKVVKDFPEYRAVFIGEGAEQAELLQITESLNLQGHVQFLGNQSQEQVSHWMKQARVFVLPSLEEGLGVVLLEALASGTPCVGGRAGGIPDVITPEVGCLVPPADPQALAEAIVQVIKTEPTWRILSANARQRAVECYDWKKIGASIYQLYQEIL